MTPTIDQIAKVLYETMPMARREQVIESAKEILKLLINSAYVQNEKQEHIEETVCTY